MLNGEYGATDRVLLICPREKFDLYIWNESICRRTNDPKDSHNKSITDIIEEPIISKSVEITAGIPKEHKNQNKFTKHIMTSTKRF